MKRIIIFILLFSLVGCSTNNAKPKSIIELVENDILINKDDIFTKLTVTEGSSSQTRETSYDYVINDFLAKLSNYEVVKWDGNPLDSFEYKVTLSSKYKDKITFIDSQYLMINDKEYKLIGRKLDLKWLYNHIQ